MAIANRGFPPPVPTLADLLARLGDVSPARVWAVPVPGTATAADLLTPATEGRCELADGMLIDIAEGWAAATVTGELFWHLRRQPGVEHRGYFVGRGAYLQLAPGLVRLPTLTFTRWDTTPDGQVPDVRICDIIPELVAEVVRPANTPREIARKVGEYLAAGVRTVIVVDPAARTAEVHTPAVTTHVPAAGTLTAAPVFPGFAVPFVELFRVYDRLFGSPPGRPTGIIRRPGEEP